MYTVLKPLPSQASYIARVFIPDSTSSSGAGLANLTYSSSGLTWKYSRLGDGSVTTVALTAGTLGTYSSGGFVAVDNANLPGWYELGVPNAVLSGGSPAQMVLSGATNMEVTNLSVELDTTTNSLLAIGTLVAGVKAQTDLLVFQSGNLQVQHDLTQAIPTSNTAQTVGDALNAARAQGFGKWTITTSGNTGTLTIYAGDNSTVVRTFTLNSATAPTSRV